MSMKTLKSNRLHIGFFGKTNTGKSSLLNKITGQDISIVSDIAGTTTDVVEKSMELLPIGSVTYLDTAGLNDDTVLGLERIKRTLKILNRTDLAVLVCDYNGLDKSDIDIINQFENLKIPFIVIVNKSDISKISESKLDVIKKYCQNIIITSVYDNNLIYEFKNALIKLLPDDFINPPKIVGDLIPEKSTVIEVIPIDKEAPKGRIILPQVQTLRDLLDSNCITLCAKVSELAQALDGLKNPPALVITDSQAFGEVAKIVPESIALTSFSILFARLKGDLKTFVKGARMIDKLQDGDRVLTGKNLIFDNISGHDFPDISKYKLIIHCGACMTNRKEVLSRILIANQKGVPITNYGITISYCLGILDRALKIFQNL